MSTPNKPKFNVIETMTAWDSELLEDNELWLAWNKESDRVFEAYHQEATFLKRKLEQLTETLHAVMGTMKDITRDIAEIKGRYQSLEDEVRFLTTQVENSEK